MGVALDGAGWHPAAWRDPTARPTELSTADYWLDLVHTAQSGLLDFVAFEDSLTPTTTRMPGTSSGPTWSAATWTRS